MLHVKRKVTTKRTRIVRGPPCYPRDPNGESLHHGTRVRVSRRPSTLVPGFVLKIGKDAGREPCPGFEGYIKDVYLDSRGREVLLILDHKTTSMRTVEARYARVLEGQFEDERLLELAADRRTDR